MGAREGSVVVRMWIEEGGMGHILSPGRWYLQHTELTTWRTSLKVVNHLYNSCLENFETY
jgi:hypothetical protein